MVWGGCFGLRGAYLDEQFWGTILNILWISWEPSFGLLGRSLKGSTTWEPAEGEQNIVLTIFIKFLLTVLPFVLFCTYLINSFTVVSKILLFPLLLGRAENAFVGKLEFLFNLLAIMWAGFGKFLGIVRGFFFFFWYMCLFFFRIVG